LILCNSNFIYFKKVSENVQKNDVQIVVLVEGILQLRKLYECNEPNLESAEEGGDLMNHSPSKEQINVMRFDCFIKKCCTNELRNIEKREKRLRSQEVLIPDFSRIETRIGSTGVKLPDFVVKGFKVSIEDMDLLGALKKLPARDRELILLIHFTGYKPKDVSNEMDVAERTIYKRHKKILCKLKYYMEGHK
jgi:RNA polymerase sigma factor (sigma-70 family)